MANNPILDIYRESHDGVDSAKEMLFQLCRLWTEFQSPQTGTCPVEYSDPSGPLSLEWAVEQGEDAAYWDAVLALIADQNILPDIDPQDFHTQVVAAEWLRGNTPEGFDADKAMSHIMLALKTLDRYTNVYGQED